MNEQQLLKLKSVHSYTFVDKYGDVMQAKYTQLSCPDCGKLLYHCLDSDMLFCNQIGCEYSVTPIEHQEWLREEQQHQLLQQLFNELYFSPCLIGSLQIPFWMNPMHTIGIGFICDLQIWLNHDNNIKNTQHWKRHSPIVYRPSTVLEAVGLISLIEDPILFQKGYRGVLLLHGTHFFVAVAPLVM